MQDTKGRLIGDQPSVIFYKDLANHLVQTMTNIVTAQGGHLLSEAIIAQKTQGLLKVYGIEIDTSE